MKSSNTKPEMVVQPLTGRVAQDDRGNAVWAIKTESGRFRQDVDTQRTLRALHSNELSANFSENVEEALSFNPYNSTGAHYSRVERQPRRTLDDLRKLSEHIKQSRQLKR